MQPESPLSGLASYRVWDLPTRLFHWINALCVLVLGSLGLVILNAGALEISNAGKVLLKTLHVWAGYLFVLNIVVRIVWAFRGNHHARWAQFMPFGGGYLLRLRHHVAAVLAGKPEPYLGHNPLGRLAIAGLLLLMVLQASTGLLLAGTDIYFPPFGAWIAQWIAAPGIDPASLPPYSPELYDAAAYADMRALRKPFALVHLYSFYLLAVGILVHIVGVVLAESRGDGTVLSAMISGRKVLKGVPVDAPAGSSGSADGKQDGNTKAP